ncbi:MAG: phosphoribosylformylglycinamidine synthase subunit PurQ [Gemmatimonadetes bacterium]|nr:phosphoribosylformylglycinamidine synthase subunit PurQ [Gemmatimonadota bacterium]
MKVAVVTFPGSNCDYDCYKAMQLFPGIEPAFVWHREQDLGGVDAVVLPGGFAHGDYLRAGAIARFSPIMKSVSEFARHGGPVVGICNGFQILCESGLLPGALLRNDTLRFRSLDVHIRVESTRTMFTPRYREGQVIRMPIAHGEGSYYAAPETLAELEGEGRIVFRYVRRDGELGMGSNPNGSQHNIAGIISADGNVLGMMPHPERAVEEILGSSDGRGLFEALAAHRTGVAA